MSKRRAKKAQKRPPRKPARYPPTKLIGVSRIGVGLTQVQASALVYAPLRTWQNWEQGKRPMPRAVWELWLLKLGALCAARDE
jgi:hypothetical protein